MHGVLAAFIAFATLFSASEAAAAQRTKLKQHSGSNAVVQTEAPQQIPSGRSTRSNRAGDRNLVFRAEHIVPDICKGCSS